MKAQVAFEYIVIVGMVLLFLIPLWAYISGVHTSTSNHIFISYAQSAASRLASHADLVYSQGPPAKIRSTVYMPPRVSSAELINKTVLISLSIAGTTTDVTAVSTATMVGTLPTTEGNYQVSVEAVGNYVNITVL